MALVLNFSTSVINFHYTMCGDFDPINTVCLFFSGYTKRRNVFDKVARDRTSVFKSKEKTAGML